jgi:type IV pilus assembly protein PilC
MAKTFAYQAKNIDGQVLSGSLVADSEAAVAAYIRGQGYFVTQIKEARQQAFKGLLLELQPVKVKELAIFCRQFATMIGAGLTLVVCLKILTEQSQNPRLKEAMQDIGRRVQEGDTLSRAMLDYPRVFPELMVSMMEAAEAGGVMDIVLERLAVHFEKEYKMNEKVKSAMTYPAVVLTFASLVVVFILTFILPTFMQQFAGMKLELPLPTRMLLAVSDLLRGYGVVLLGVLIALGGVLKLNARRPGIRRTLDRLALQVPVFGKLSRKVAVARFTRILATLLRGGVPILTALAAVSKTTGNSLLIEALAEVQTSVRDGHGLSGPLAASGVFPPMAVQMVAVGEEAGELDRMLDKLADFYESDVDDMVGRLSALLEPILIAVLAVVVGGIVLAMMLPMFDVIANFK